MRIPNARHPLATACATRRQPLACGQNDLQVEQAGSRKKQTPNFSPLRPFQVCTGPPRIATQLPLPIPTLPFWSQAAKPTPPICVVSKYLGQCTHRLLMFPAAVYTTPTSPPFPAGFAEFAVHASDVPRIDDRLTRWDKGLRPPAAASHSLLHPQCSSSAGHLPIVSHSLLCGL